ncbi:hypothetical protein ACFORG_09195 [Lutimaribacter marinistellae]|uniref:DUF2946 domain-containing protein n=1 Tax=Lutimaribacter marinistellae TaxID=1820329 RepID=A0ABV7TJF4_9RHOB
MKRCLSILSAYCLALLLALTGQGLAQSRGMSTAAGQITLCTGTGPVVIYVDDQGQPAPAPHYCPDFALSLLGALLPERAQPPLPEEASPILAESAHIGANPAPIIRHRARGPPVPV